MNNSTIRPFTVCKGGRLRVPTLPYPRKLTHTHTQKKPSLSIPSPSCFIIIQSTPRRDSQTHSHSQTAAICNTH